MCPATLRNQELTIRVLDPVYKVLRIMDRRKGATLSDAYPLCLQIDALYSSPIEGLDEGLCEKMHDLYMAKWEYFHEEVHNASYMVHKEFIRRDHSASEKEEFKRVIKKMATEEHTYVKIVSQYQRALTAINSGANDFTDEMAFSPTAMSCAAFEWSQTWLSDYSDLQWAATRLVSIRTGSSACEHYFGVEAWIHSKKRNRLGHLNVERLLRSHTNMVIEEGLRGADGVDFLPWDIELVIEEPEEEEEDVNPDEEEEEEQDTND